MGDPNITMEEYIRLEEEKAQRHGRTFNWQTATFGKVKYHEDEDDCFTDFETEFPAIVFDNTLPCEPTVSPMFGKVESYEDEDDCFIDLEIKFPAIVFYNTLTSDTTLLCAPTASPPNKNKIDLRIS
ncbi:hypothetical protein Tco_0864859 [Tanacetum coccineum]